MKTPESRLTRSKQKEMKTMLKVCTFVNFLYLNFLKCLVEEIQNPCSRRGRGRGASGPTFGYRGADESTKSSPCLDQKKA